ncbi:hypothetical protein [Nocardioides sp.]|uniref:hypothetical protein n=1 Tax=Nocardioides sp. TaxID=35761 RepID=UPI002B64AB01|nr:hypothetical protein [Nocardioides sp.]HXH80349.1 hypothetical protein [Nocardioides sp.]
MDDDWLEPEVLAGADADAAVEALDESAEDPDVDSDFESDLESDLDSFLGESEVDELDESAERLSVR